MKLKIVSKGSPENTYVVNAATGEAVENVSSILWVRHTDGRVYAEIRVDAVAVDATTDAGHVIAPPAPKPVAPQPEPDRADKGFGGKRRSEK